MRRFLIAVLMSFALLCSVHALAATQQLLVTDRAINAIYRYDASTGAYLGAFQQVSQLSQPMGMATGSDGLLYVASSGNNQILRYNLATGSFVDVFATSQSRLNAPDSLAFGPDGKLYVSNSGSIVRFNTQTGGYETFVQDAGPFPATGLRYPSGITFGLSGDLYACAQCSTYPVYRYNVVNAQQVESYPANDKLLSPGRLAFAPDGTLYIATKGSGAIYKYDVASRQYAEMLLPVQSSLNSIAFSSNGSLYLVQDGSHEISIYNATTRVFDLFSVGNMLQSPSSIMVTSVPEPASAAALVCGLGSFLPMIIRRRKR